MQTDLLPGESFNDWAKRAHNHQLINRVSVGNKHIADIDRTTYLDFIQIMRDIGNKRLTASERYNRHHDEMFKIVWDNWDLLSSGELINFDDPDTCISKYYRYGEGWCDELGEPIIK